MITELRKIWIQNRTKEMLATGQCPAGLHPIVDLSEVSAAGYCKKCEAKRSENGRQSDPKKQLLVYAKQRAARYGVPLSITIDDFDLPEFCPVFAGIRLEAQTSKGVQSDCSPSLDKIIPELGYVKGNIMVMSMRANSAKRNLTLDELIQLGEWAQRAKKEKGL